MVFLCFALFSPQSVTSLARFLLRLHYFSSNSPLQGISNLPSDSDIATKACVYMHVHVYSIYMYMCIAYACTFV